MDDLISRQAAIDTIGDKFDEIYKTKQKGATYPHDDFFQGMAYAENIVRQLPSAQPEIIRCSECSYHKEMHLPPTDTEDAVTITWCEKHRIANVKDDDFCSRWERKNG